MTRYDRVIPPGGTGKIILTIDSNRVRGEFEKRAVVWSNDPERRSIALYLIGKIKPHISIEPGGYISFWGVKDQVPREHLDIINNHNSPLKILSIDTDLKGRIRWDLKEIKSGYIYRLEVEDISKTSEEYTGHLFVRTDNPKKPALSIIINRQNNQSQ